jgi:hypothetical protein
MPQLLPFRQYDERDVLNVFALSGYAADVYTIVNRGTLVKVAGDGMKLDTLNPVEFLGNPSAFSPINVVSQRYGAIPKVVPANAGDKILGMTLFDVRETDENGELLKFRPRKAAELEAVISGQAVPIVRKGIFAYSGVCTGNGLTGSVTAGTTLYAGANATLSSFASGNSVGVVLGTTDFHGVTTVLLDVSA